MTTNINIDNFINWLIDNNIFNDFIKNFKVNNNIKTDVFHTLKKQLRETNVADFMGIAYPDNTEKDVEWRTYFNYKYYVPNERYIPKKGDYITYNVTRYGVTCKYISIVNHCDKLEDLYVYEICSLCVESDDEEMIDMIDFDTEVCITEEDVVSDYRFATMEEIDRLDSFLKEDGLMFDTDIKKIVNI